MLSRIPRLLLLGFSLFYCSFTISGDSNSQADTTSSDNALVGSFDAGEERYKKSCINCHGTAGKGVASYPKVSGQELSYTIEKLETYRNGIKIGPNSSLMIMMAKPLTDQEIADLAVYLKDATY